MTIFSTGTFANDNGANTLVLDGDTAYTNSTYPQGVNFHSHQIEITAGDNTTGTITVTGTSPSRSAAEPVYKSDGTTALEINLAESPRTFPINNVTLKNLIFTFASLNGSDDVDITVSSWDFS